ncbi:phospholipase D-like domain-containing protein [Pontibacter sp. E15-1]|uniref:phospholipase D-like domain-containing protein n=1 Tax=Pontibacter sp. E15-1 TaxID=2919918 RepID=UPI001F4FCD91|nr:phospholipase D-like domain-containing protein [Pontibacter sp. E15-1]MCJ8165034.1 phospholipase D-like domain-containing protein [Pontibacter sp. E15-1]
MNQAYFSPGNDCLQAIQDNITATMRSIKICVFTISDDRITEALLRACHKGVQVQLLTDNKKLYDLGSDIRKLAAEGISVRIDRTHNHMHHKFAIFDQEALLTGSYNWTRSAANYNHENLLVTNQPDLVSAYLHTFEKLWAEMAVYKVKRP